VLVLQDRPTRARLLWLVGLTALALLTHPRSLPLLIPVALTFGFVLFARTGRRRLWLTGAVWVTYLVAAFVAVSRGQGIPRQFASYVWQFYLPRLPGMTPSIGPPNYDFGELYVSHFYGSLASTEVEISYPLERVLFWATILGLVALVLVLIRQRAAVRAQAPLAIVLGSAVLALILGLHVGAYRGMLGNPGDPVLTGRYLLPLLPLFGAGIALVARAVPRRAGVVVAGVILGGGIVLQFWSLGHVLERFYA
jgi:hypothetical protein